MCEYWFLSYSDDSDEGIMIDVKWVNVVIFQDVKFNNFIIMTEWFVLFCIIYTYTTAIKYKIPGIAYNRMFTNKLF